MVSAEIVDWTAEDSPDGPPCATHELLGVIGNRWTVLVIIELGDNGETRSADLKRAVEGISQKVLTDCLRRLQSRGFVRRTVKDTVPISVSYDLTPFGREFFKVLSPLRTWADLHADRLQGERGRPRDERPALHG